MNNTTVCITIFREKNIDLLFACQQKIYEAFAFAMIANATSFVDAVRLSQCYENWLEPLPTM